MSGPRHDPEAVLRRIEWTVLRRLEGLLYGDYRTLFRGQGLDLADLREYQPHDDVRHIDWNVTARLQTPHVREYHEDREITAWFLLDVSPSLDFGSEGLKKEAVLADFVALLARLLTRNGNRVGAMLYGSELEVPIPPGAGRTQVLQILHRLLSRSRKEDPRVGNGETTDLGAFLTGAAHIMKRRSFVFVVSDFISLPGWGESLLNLARRHEVLAVRLFDPLELALPDLGLVMMQDAETGEQILVDTHDPAFRARFQEVARKQEAELRSTLHQAGVDALELSTDGELVDAILRFADLRRTRSQLAARGAFPNHLEVGP
jgi:uncharacterized protein (DUF58 family)